MRYVLLEPCIRICYSVGSALSDVRLSNRRGRKAKPHNIAVSPTRTNRLPHGIPYAPKEGIVFEGLIPPFCSETANKPSLTGPDNTLPSPRVLVVGQWNGRVRRTSAPLNWPRSPPLQALLKKLAWAPLTSPRRGIFLTPVPCPA